MNKKIFFLAAVAACAIFLSRFYFVSPTESPEKAAERFTENLFKVAPPKLDKTAIKNTIDQLSDNAKNQIKSLGDIAHFSGVQKLPDRGFKTINVDKKENKALVKMRWDYSGGAVMKKFFMVFENGSWKIDLIKNSKI
ncbi:MAG: hypothetical protein WC527_00720 [Candidatus Margulisiibacteriota bacterium]